MVWRWQLYVTFIRDNKDGQLFQKKDKNWKNFVSFVIGIWKQPLMVTVGGEVEVGIPVFTDNPSLLKWQSITFNHRIIILVCQIGILSGASAVSRGSRGSQRDTVP